MTVTGQVVTVVYVVRVSVSAGVKVGYPVNSDDDVVVGYPVNSEDVVVVVSETLVEFVPYLGELAAAVPRKMAAREIRVLCIANDQRGFNHRLILNCKQHTSDRLYRS